MKKFNLLFLISIFVLEINSMEFKEEEQTNYIEMSEELDEDFFSGLNNSEVVINDNFITKESSKLRKSCSDENFLDEGINYQIKKTINEINKINFLIEKFVQESTDESTLKILDQIRQLKISNIKLQKMYAFLCKSLKSKHEKNQKEFSNFLKNELEKIQKQLNEEMKKQLNEFKNEFLVQQSSSVKQQNEEYICCMDTFFCCLKK